jgi:hypothetical protein
VLCPKKAYKDPDGKNRIFDEMWTGDWWWNLQVSIGIFTSPCFAISIGWWWHPGAVWGRGSIIPVILASDKTNLSNFTGDKTAWPVYLTIGNIEKSVHQFAGYSMTAWDHFWILSGKPEKMGLIWFVQMASFAVLIWFSLPTLWTILNNASWPAIMKGGVLNVWLDLKSLANLSRAYGEMVRLSYRPWAMQLKEWAWRNLTIRVSDQTIHFGKAFHTVIYSRALVQIFSINFIKAYLKTTSLAGQQNVLVEAKPRLIIDFVPWS